MGQKSHRGHQGSTCNDYVLGWGQWFFNNLEKQGWEILSKYKCHPVSSYCTVHKSNCIQEFWVIICKLDSSKYYAN